jgi:hypothetical protein
MDSSFDWAEPFSFFHRFYLWPFHKSMFNQSLSFEYRLARTRVIKKRKRRAELSARSIETFLKKKKSIFSSSSSSKHLDGQTVKTDEKTKQNNLAFPITKKQNTSKCTFSECYLVLCRCTL